MRRLSTPFAASAVALSLAFSPAAMAQQTTTQGGTSGGVEGRNVSASTYGYGARTPTGTAVDGGGEAVAVDGSASTRTDAKANERRAMQRSVATATAEEERARSRTRTMVQPNGTVRSTTRSMYHARGEKPVKESSTVVVRPDGTTTTRDK